MEFGDAFEAAPIELCGCAPMLDPRGQVPQLHVEYRSLNIVKQRRVAVTVVLASLAFFSVVSKEPRHTSHFGIVCRHRAAVAKASQDFEWIEAEAACQAERSRPLPFECSSESLRRIFYHLQTVLSRDSHDAIHLANATIQVHRKNGLCTRCNRPFELGGIKVVILSNIH